MEKLNYFYHPFHTSTRLSKGLGSSASTGLSNLWITDGTGQAIQHLHYLPFGEDWVDQRTTSWNAPYTFSGKEKDAETGYGYFGARYYDSGLSIWLSVDPMAEKYPYQTNYVYCSNNPIRIIDPNGEDEYFDSFGVYLGSDGDANSSNIRITTAKSFQDSKNSFSENEKPILQSTSPLLSESEMTNSNRLKVYNHYNNTGLNLVDERAESEEDLMTYSASLTMSSLTNSTYVTEKISIDVEQQKSNPLLNNFNNIISSFDHEEGHSKQMNSLTFDLYSATPSKFREQFAINYQTSIKKENFLKTTLDFKINTYKYFKANQ